ncbi:MAG: cytochrome c [Proteobacteria bacterium]|nr:cytochrome c [Pseudomonadota bacterium]
MKQKAIVIILTLLVVPGLINAATPDKIPRITSIAVHNGQVQQYFAATNAGLYSSRDGGLTWTIAGYQQLPATLVSETTAGTLYAFVVGKGLLRLDQDNSRWQPVNNQFGSQYLVELSAEPGSPDKLIALNQFGKLIVSNNSGKDWHSVKGPYKTSSEAEARGLSLYKNNCQACHGIDGVGETYNMQALTDKDYLRAPAMNDSEHAWHHTDEALVKTILEGSPREPRMLAWKKNGLTEQNAQDLVAYIKSLWTQRELDCQGPKHMNCPS